MSNILRVLIVEDSYEDMLLELRMLQHEGFVVEASTQVLTREGLEDALFQHDWDIVLSDYSMPSFSALEALEVVRASGKDLPFIIVSGSVGEEVAVAAMRAGADDYLMKDRLQRLGAAVSRAVADSKVRIARRQAEEKLKQSQKLENLGLLASGIAHDFNNILTAVVGYSELALQTLDSSHPASEDLQNALAASERARQLARQILTFARGGPIVRQEMSVDTLLRDTRRMMGPLLHRNIQLVVEPPQSDICISGDPSQLHQILVNLCINASHAIGAKPGQITLSARQRNVAEGEAGLPPDLSAGKYVVVEVRDNGCGMDQQTLEQAFEPFFTTKPAGTGTGLGLSVSRDIAVGHEGAMGARSIPGEGTVVELYLPVCGAGTAESSAAELSPQGRNERVLLVDDEQLLADLCGMILDKTGYRVKSMTSSREALELLRKDPNAFDVLVADHDMPQVRGTELAQQALALRPGMPVVLCSGSMLPELEDFVALHPDVLLLEKPYNRSGLLTALSKALGRTSQASSA